jgi:hypothetical protein
MFRECPVVVSFWNKINQLARMQWPDHEDMSWSDIPRIAGPDYRPKFMMQMAGLWAIWLTWCHYFHSGDPIGELTASWEASLLDTFNKQLIKRIYESIQISQWKRLLSCRLSEIVGQGIDPEDTRRVTEKEFLLCYAHRVVTNPDHIDLEPDGETDEYYTHGIIKSWYGNGHFVVEDTSHHRPRLRIIHKNLPALDIQGPLVLPPRDPADGWAQPAFITT